MIRFESLNVILASGSSIPAIVPEMMAIPALDLAMMDLRSTQLQSFVDEGRHVQTRDNTVARLENLDSQRKTTMLNDRLVAIDCGEVLASSRSKRQYVIATSDVVVTYQLTDWTYSVVCENSINAVAMRVIF